MGEYYYRDLETVLFSLKHDLPNVPLELQLCYLFEVIVRTFHKPINSEKYRTRISFAYDEYPAVFTDVMVNLRLYRNTFIHCGYTKATGYYEDLIKDKELLDILASTLGVTLDWNFRLEVRN